MQIHLFKKMSTEVISKKRSLEDSEEESVNRRNRANSFIESADKITNEEIFNFSSFLKLTNDNVNENFGTFKNISKKIHFNNNEVLRLDENSYIQESEFQNIKISPDCFDDDGNLVDIFPSSTKYQKIKINNIPKNYYEYIQVLLNVLNLDKCVVYIYNFIECDNTREVRRSGIKLNDENYGIFINKSQQDIYWVLQHIQRIVVNRNSNFSSRLIRNVNRQFMSVDIEKYVTPKTKKRKIDYLGSNWIAASKTRNAALNDHCLDYFRAYNVLDINDNPEKREFSFEPSSKYERINKTSDNAVSFIDFLLTSGNIFEEDIIKKIKSKYRDEFIKICESYESRNINNYKKTIEEMKKGTPIIYQPVLYCYKHQVFGCADLIIRSDWLNKITNSKILSEKEEKISSIILEKDYHYRVIDIKFSKLHFNTDETTLRNNSNVKPFKTQIALYNLALGEMQGYIPNQSYILGNGWIMNKVENKKTITKSSKNPFDKFGTIDYKDKDNFYLETSLDAIKWLKELNESNGFTHDPPNDPRIYPNMCNTYDGIYNKVKRQIAEKYNDITLLPQCGTKNRDIAFSKNITSFSDERCNSETLGIKGEKTKKLVNSIIKFNRQQTRKININKIKNNYGNWRNNELNLFIDFETIGSLLLESNVNSNIGINGDFIFMIGLGWNAPNSSEWNYECFYCNKISLEEESKMIRNFITKIDNLKILHGRINNVYHWSSAELTHYKKLNERYSNLLPNFKWFDLMKFFKKNDILIHGALNFSLKTIANKMYSHGMIKTVWEDSECENGQDAMFKAWQIYINETEDKKIFNDIIKYNEIDCKTMFEILNYLKLKH